MAVGAVGALNLGAVAGWAVLEGGGPSATWAQMSRGCFGGARTAPLALTPQRARRWLRYAARSRHHLVNVEGMPAARRALLSARPHVIWWLPTGRDIATQLVNSLRGALDMGMRETCPAHRRRRQL